MILHTLKLRDFRAHASTDVKLESGINIIDGPNGAGKTNILEAVHYLCLSKSFLNVQDRNVIRTGADFFQIEGAFESHTGRKQVVRAAYMPDSGKRLFVNGAALDRHVDIVGRIPVVVIEPGASNLTMGGPAHRRQFLDKMLSQARPAYLENLMRYRRALRQRNDLLSRQHSSRIDSGVLDTLTSVLVDMGTRVIAGRLKFLNELDQFLQQAYSLLRLVRQEPSITYASLISKHDGEPAHNEIESIFAQALYDTREREHSTGRTCAGPHLDELVFKLNGQQLRRFASTGQHRAFGIALKLAQYLYLQHTMEESPILLLDDIFDSLDEVRVDAILTMLQNETTGQSLITTTDATSYLGRVKHADPLWLRIENGRVTKPLPVP